MINNTKYLLYSLFTVGVLSAIGCSKSSELGLSLVEGEQTDILITDTTSLFFTTLKATSSKTNNRTQVVVGAYSSLEWGDVEASAYMNFRLTSTNASFSNTVFDSLVLTIAYENYGHYGELRETKPTTAMQSWDVVRIGSDISATASYTSSATFVETDILKAGFQFTPNDTADVVLGTSSFDPHIRIRLDDIAGLELGETLLHPSAGADSIYTSNNVFKNWFKGVHIKPTFGHANNTIIRLKVQSPLTKLTLYYRDTVGGANTAKTFDFLTTEDAEAVTVFNNNTPASLTANLETDTVSYMQGLDALHTRIDFPYVGNLGNIIVNKAELLIMVADTGSKSFPEPIQITAKIKDKSGQLVVVDDIATSLINTQSYFLFGGLIERNNDILMYRFHLSEEMQAVIKGETYERAIYLTASSALDAERIKLINQNGFLKPKLFLTYTKVK